MREILTLLAFGLSAAMPAMGQEETDTLFYDRNWKGLEYKTFATYYRVVPQSNDSTTHKPYRTYYITGEIQSDGGYITIDKDDDSKSVFDGEWINYYKSGQIEEKGNRIRGKKEGEYTKYDKDGLVLIHAYYSNDKLQGIYTEFSEDGTVCTQIEFNDGEPLYDYYVISNQDGLCSKVSLSDQQPIYECPSLDEREVECSDENYWSYYNKNGIKVYTTVLKVRDYGSYFQIPIIIANNSMYPIEFDPDNVTASMTGSANDYYAPYTDRSNAEYELTVFSVAEYMKRVERQQNWAIALIAFSAGITAASAGYSTSTTITSYSGAISGSSISTTTSYNPTLAFQAQVLASDRIAFYGNALLAERETKDVGYLKKTTIYPGEIIYGYINIEQGSGKDLTVNLDVNGIAYPFKWALERKSITPWTEQNQNSEKKRRRIKETDDADTPEGE